MMNCLIVTAHPLKECLCAHLTRQTVAHLETRGYTVTVKDLYKERFDPVLTRDERASYYRRRYDRSLVEKEIEQLEHTESLVLIFPTWWFGFPAILKGWFDRVWAPDVAFRHDRDLKAIVPCLDNLKELKVITTLGSPWWVDFFALRQPVKKVLKTALLGACAKRCSFKMLSLYKSEKLTKEKVQRFVEKIRAAF